MIASIKTQFFPRTRKIIKFSVLSALCAALFFPVSPRPTWSQTAAPRFQWPIVLGEYPDLRGITSSFGESRTDHFHNGVDIAALDRPVHPAAPGEILYTRQLDDDPFHPLPGPGNHLFMIHEGGWTSGYYHLTHLPIRSGRAEATTSLGNSGNTGHSAGAHLHFFFVDPEGRYINPMLLLPSVTDANPPIIGQLMIKTPTSRTLISHSRQENIRLSRYFPVLVRIIDPGLEKGTRRGVYKLSWQLNGGPTKTHDFRELVFRDGDWRLSTGAPFPEVFGRGQYLLGKLEFQGGDNTLVVTAEDLKGNSTSVTYTINVNKEF